jgi:hypothetical protein
MPPRVAGLPCTPSRDRRSRWRASCSRVASPSICHWCGRRAFLAAGNAPRWSRCSEATCFSMARKRSGCGAWRPTHLCVAVAPNKGMHPTRCGTIRCGSHLLIPIPGHPVIRPFSRNAPCGSIKRYLGAIWDGSEVACRRSPKGGPSKERFSRYETLARPLTLQTT